MKVRAADALVGAGVALAMALAMASSLWIALWPDFYQGIAEIARSSGQTPPEASRVSASFLEVNDLWGALMLAVPVLITSGAFWVIWLADYRRLPRRPILWALAWLLLLFCGASAMSIGIFYVPSTLALMAAAVLSLRRLRPGVSP